jgi:predicted dehydrogenase
MKPIRVSIIGAGGYAAKHRETVEQFEKKGITCLSSVVIRNPNKANYQELEKTLRSQGAAVYSDSAAMLAAEKGKSDLIIISSSIEQHEPQSVSALRAGFHILCEKPVSGTIAEALRMKKAQEETGKILAIGYHNIFSETIQKIKKITCENKLGKLLKAKTLMVWPRTIDYYSRNSWAGKMYIEGTPIYDCALHNAGSHFLNNMLYIAGRSPDEAADIAEVYGENYRAKEIECADTQYVRIKTADGVVLHEIVTHACSLRREALTEYYYEHGKIVWKQPESMPSAAQVFHITDHGAYKLYEEFDDGQADLRATIYLNLFEAMKRGTQPLSTIANSLQETLVVEACFASGGAVVSVPHQYLQKTAELENNPVAAGAKEVYNIVIKDIEKVCEEMFAHEIGFYEYGLPWAKKSRTRAVHQYSIL